MNRLFIKFSQQKEGDFWSIIDVEKKEQLIDKISSIYNSVHPVERMEVYESYRKYYVAMKMEIEECKL